jgi:hypothetical protein
MADKESCNSNKIPSGFIAVPVPAPSKSIEELEKTKGIFTQDEFRELAKENILTAIQLYKNNEFERCKTHANVAINMYLELESYKCPFHPNELVYINLLMNMINPDHKKK